MKYSANVSSSRRKSRKVGPSLGSTVCKRQPSRRSIAAAGLHSRCTHQPRPQGPQLHADLPSAWARRPGRQCAHAWLRHAHAGSLHGAVERAPEAAERSPLDGAAQQAHGAAQRRPLVRGAGSTRGAAISDWLPAAERGGARHCRTDGAAAIQLARVERPARLPARRSARSRSARMTRSRSCAGHTRCGAASPSGAAEACMAGFWAAAIPPARLFSRAMHAYGERRAARARSSASTAGSG
jgi:hypothetical protein